MDISQLRDLASVGPARAALVVGQVPSQGTGKRWSSRLGGKEVGSYSGQTRGGGGGGLLPIGDW